jgi:uncharacterized protein
LDIARSASNHRTYFALATTGVTAGFFSAMFGVGGGIVIVPLLLLWLHFEARSATATSLAAIGITAAAGVVGYSSHGQVRPLYAVLVGIPAAVAAIGGSSLQQRIHTTTIERLFSLLLAGVAAWPMIK